MLISNTNTYGGHVGLSTRLRTSLDAIRALAAGYVVLHHVASVRGWSHSGPGLLLRFGQEAVIVFFLLSGFVIFANERRRVLTSPLGYAIRRAKRIYPLLIISMLISALVEIDNGDFPEKFRWFDMIGTLLGLQDISSLKPGVIVEPFLGNDPLWSISYELLFYILFPFVMVFWRRNASAANAFIGVSCCLSYLIFLVTKNHFALMGAYFLLWWSGAMISHAYLKGERSILSSGDVISWLALLCVISAIGVQYEGYTGAGFYPFLMLRHFCAGVAMLVLASGPIGRLFLSYIQILRRPAAYIASISYGLYVLHYPILVMWHRDQSVLFFIFGVFLLVASSHVFDRVLNRALSHMSFHRAAANSDQ